MILNIWEDEFEGVTVACDTIPGGISHVDVDMVDESMDGLALHISYISSLSYNVCVRI